MMQPTFVVEVPVAPITSSMASALASGAYANVFVLAVNGSVAVNQAVSQLAESGWASGDQVTVRKVTAANFESGSVALEYFEQCQTDGLVISLHTWRTEH